MNNILIGTSGFDYPEWKGVFYPEDLRRKDFLSYYASVFNTLELNNTFYSMPTNERLKSLAERSDNKLQFSIKVNQLLTHQIGYNWQSDSDAFLSSLDYLLSHNLISSLLFQFPQSFHYTDVNRRYLAAVTSRFQSVANCVCVEFRNSEWLKDSVFDGFVKRNLSLVFCDMPELKHLPNGLTCNTPFIGNIAYIRLHGRNANAWYCNDTTNNGSSRYVYDYSDEELKQFIPIIKQASNEGKKTVVYFNNHPNGSGAKNARKLKELLL